MAIQNDDTLITKGDLKNLYSNKILPYLGGNFALATNVSDYYSTDEKIVGIWTDGKPVYQKTWTNIDISGMIDGINHNIIDITSLHADTTIKVEAIAHQLTSGQKYDYPNTFFNPASSSTSQPLKVNVWRRAENYIGINATNLEITSVDITFCYTKTTDSAGSAAATPGCYDINRPDLWPTNQEVFFGNGLYGKRYTGTITPTSTLSVHQIDASFNSSWMIKNCGGWFSRGCALNACNTNLAYMLYATSNTLNIQAKDSSSGSNYDIWVIYTK